MQKMSVLILLMVLWAPVVQTGAAGAKQPLNFTLPTVEGGELSLSDFRGRVVVIDFFGTWCGPCKAALTNLDKMQKEYGKSGLSVLGYALDEQGVKLVRPFVAKLGIGFPVVMGDLKKGRGLTPIQVLPTTLVIDPQGRQAARYEGYVSPDQILKTMRPHFTKNPPPPPQAAKVKQRQPGQNRFQRIWPSYDQALGGQGGMFLHVMADVADLAAEQGLWLAVHIRPEARSGGGLVPLAKEKPFYMRIDDVSQRYFIMFVSCAQFPAAPTGGVYRSWVSIMGPNLRALDTSGELILQPPNCVAAKAR
jgi:thiol-disulfide isomerase/thioredoxin